MKSRSHYSHTLPLLYWTQNKTHHYAGHVTKRAPQVRGHLPRCCFPVLHILHIFKVALRLGSGSGRTNRRRGVQSALTPPCSFISPTIITTTILPRLAQPYPASNLQFEQHDDLETYLFQCARMILDRLQALGKLPQRLSPTRLQRSDHIDISCK